jgi:hypothetical protein
MVEIGMFDIFLYHDREDDVIYCNSIGIPTLLVRLDLEIGCTWGDVAKADPYIIFYERVMKDHVGPEKWLRYCKQLHWTNKGMLDKRVTKLLSEEGIAVDDPHGFIKEFPNFLANKRSKRPLHNCDRPC